MKSSIYCHVAVIFCIGCIASSSAVGAFSDCGSKLSTVANVQVSGCDGSQAVCILKRNSNVTISLDLTPNAVVSKINTVVHGIMSGMPIPFPLEHPNACEGTGLSCPIQPGQTYKYSAIMSVLKAYPKVAVDVKWELRGDDGSDLVCLLIPAKIQ